MAIKKREQLMFPLFYVSLILGQIYKYITANQRLVPLLLLRMFFFGADSTQKDRNFGANIDY